MTNTNNTRCIQILETLSEDHGMSVVNNPNYQKACAALYAGLPMGDHVVELLLDEGRDPVVWGLT